MILDHYHDPMWGEDLEFKVGSVEELQRGGSSIAPPRR